MGRVASWTWGCMVEGANHTCLVASLGRSAVTVLLNVNCVVVRGCDARTAVSPEHGGEQESESEILVPVLKGPLVVKAHMPDRAGWPARIPTKMHDAVVCRATYPDIASIIVKRVNLISSEQWVGIRKQPRWQAVFCWLCPQLHQFAQRHPILFGTAPAVDLVLHRREPDCACSPYPAGQADAQHGAAPMV